MDTIGLLLIAALFGLGWWRAMGARNRARHTARRACRKADVLFLDEVAFKRITVGRGTRGQLCLIRTYVFEFIVQGNHRYAGAVTLEGQRVTSVYMEPHPLQSHMDDSE